MKSQFLTSLAFIVVAVGCGHKSGSKSASPAHPAEVVRDQANLNPGGDDGPDLPNLSASNGAVSYRAFCVNPIRPELGTGERVIPSIPSEGGEWHLERLRVFSSITDSDGDTGAIVGEYSGGRSLVTCHNTYENGTGSRVLNANFEAPFEINANSGVYTSMGKLVLQARKGKTAAQLQILSQVKELPPSTGPDVPGVKGILVKMPDGKIALRFVMIQNNGLSTSTLAAEAVWMRVR